MLLSHLLQKNIVKFIPPIKLDLLRQIYKPNQKIKSYNYQAQHIKPNIPNPTHQAKSIKPNLLNKTYLAKHTKSHLSN